MHNGTEIIHDRGDSMADTSFTNLVPGFDFLQNLVKNAGSAMPSMGQWIAPTLNPDELEKRIDELRTVQFWLEQNARMLAASVQALEVQRMTLSTLKTMNVQMEDLRDSLSARGASGDSADAPSTGSRGAGKGGAQEPAAAMVDPVQWWGALTKQFSQLAASAMQEPAGTPVGEPAKAPSSLSAAKAPIGGAARKRAAPKR